MWIVDRIMCIFLWSKIVLAILPLPPKKFFPCAYAHEIHDIAPNLQYRKLSAFHEKNFRQWKATQRSFTNLWQHKKFPWQFPSNLVTFTEEILNGKLHFCAVYVNDETCAILRLKFYWRFFYEFHKFLQTSVCNTNYCSYSETSLTLLTFCRFKPIICYKCEHKQLKNHDWNTKRWTFVAEFKYVWLLSGNQARQRV